jgi:membrane-associated phospholipid phosphatase
MSEARAPGNVDPRIWAAVGWPGFAPQSRIIPPLVAAAVGHLTTRTEAMWQLAAWGVVPVGQLLKRSFNRPRPPSAWLRFGSRKPTGSSFPSTHAATYTAFYGFTAIVLVARGGPSRLMALIPVGLVALVGPSRVHEGDHWLSDVVGGHVLGAIYLAILLGARRAFAKRRSSGQLAKRRGVEDGSAPARPLQGGAGFAPRAERVLTAS